MVKTSSKLSKVLSMLIVLSMVLSSMAFTLPVSAEGTELFYEDFNSTEFNSSTGTVDTTVVTKATLDGTTVDGTTVTWQAAADGTADATTQVIFEDGVLKVNKGVHSHGGQLTTVALATGMETDTTGSGYIVFETDFKPTSISAKSAWNDYGGEIVILEAGSGATLAAVSLGQANGLQDLVGSSTSSTTYADVDANAANGVNYKENLGTAEGLENKDIKVRVVWDIKNKQTLTTAAVDGETGSRVSTAGWHAVATGGHVRIGGITFKALAANGSAAANYQFDNVKLTKYPATDVLTIADSTVAAYAEDVATTGTIDLTFSDDIDAGSIGGIKLKKGDGTLVTPDSVEMNGTDGVTISYSALEELTAYTITTSGIVLSSETGLPVIDDEITFTTLTTVVGPEPVGTVLWSDDFTGLDSTTLDALVAEDATARRGWSARIQAGSTATSYTSTNNTWAAVADGSYTDPASVNKVILGNGKATLIKSKAEAHGGCNTTLWGTPSFTMPTEGYLVFDADYKAISMPRKSGTNNYNGDIVLYNGTETSANERAHWSISTTSGMQDLLGYSTSTVLTDDANNMGTSEGLENTTIHVQFIYDLDNGKVITVATPAGQATRVSSKGWVDFDKESFVVPTIKFDLRDANGSGTAEVIYDNVMFRSVVDRAFTFESSSVEDAETDVAVDGTIDLTFSEDVSELSLANITLTDGENAVDCDVTLDGTDASVVHITYEGLDYETEYTVNVPLSVVAAETNHPLTAAQEISFTTEAEPVPETPMVLSTTPAGAAYDVDVDQDIVITFNVPMDETSLDNIKLYKDTVDEANVVALTKEVSADKKTVTFTHETLLNEQFYVFVVPTSVVSDDDVAMAAQATYTFTTEGYDPVIWSEDFSTLPTGVTADTTVSAWYTDGWGAHVQADGHIEGANEFRFVDGKLQMTKAQTEASKNKGLVAPKNITGAPETGIVTLDYDYTISSNYLGDAYSPAMVLLNGAGQQLLGLTFGASYTGIQVNQIKGDGEVLSGSGAVSGAPVADRSFGSGSSAAYTALTDGNGTIHVRVVIDLDAKVYSMVLTKGGVEYTTPKAYYEIDPDITDVKIAQVIFQANCSTTSANYTEDTVVSTFDNIVLRVADPVAIAVEEASVTNGATNVTPNEDIEIVFTEDVKESTLAGITLTAGATPVAFTPVLAKDRKTVTLDFETLGYNTEYTLTIPATIKSSTGAALSAPEVVTFTTAGEPAEGTVLWSENFDDVTIENVAELHEDWKIAIADSDVGATSSAWTDATTYGPKAYFEGGKLKLTDLRTSWHGGTNIRFTMPMTPSTTPSSGYTVLEFDYQAPAMAVKNRFNEWSNVDVLLSGRNDGRTYGKLSLTTTGGVQNLHGLGALGSQTALDEIVKGSAKDNIMSTEGYAGENIHVAYIFDLSNMKYMVSATKDGEKAFHGSEWIQLDASNVGAAPSTGWFIGYIALTLGEAPVGGEGLTEVTYDNFSYTHYTADKLPAFISATLADNATDVATSGTIDLTFSKKIDPASISAITLAADGTPVEIEAAMNGETGATITYADLEGNTEYELTVVVTDKNGLPMAAPEVITFTTVADAVTPDPVTVVSTSVLTDVAIDANFEFTFSKAIDDATLAGITVMAGATPVDFATSVDGAVLTINPDADLAYETSYTVTLPATIAAADGGAFAGAEYTFTTEEEVIIIPAPTVVEITPANNATGVAVDTDIVIEFSKAMNASTLTNITIKAGETPVAYSTPVVVGNVVTITPNDDLANGTTYTVTIPNTVLAEDTGVFAGAEYTFTTEAGAIIPDPVTVSSIVPADEATGIAIDANIVVTFSKAINDTTIDGITVMAGATPVAFEASVEGAVLTINPDADLAYETEYTVTLPATIAAADGGVFAGAASTFTTVEEPVVIPDPVTLVSVVPANAATDIAIDANIVVTFSKAIDDATLAGITLKAGDLPVAFTATVDGAVLTINPDSDLANGTVYTVVLPATIAAADGGAFAGATSTFTTVAVLPDPDPTPSTGTELWSQDFDAISALSGDALNTYMATNYSNWSAQIGTAPGQYSATNYSLGTGFTWAEGMTKYVTADNKGGLLGFANGRVKLGIPSYMGHGSTETKVTIPLGTVDMTDVNYAVFEFDYYSERIGKRGTNQNFNSGNVVLQNADGESIARISIGTAWGIQDLADLATLNATTIGEAANNLGTASAALHGKTIHFTVVFDIANSKYTIAVTPEGGETTARMNGSTPWISLPDGVTADSFAKIVLSEKDYINTSGISSSEYDNFKITGYEALPSVVSSSIANGATGIATDGSIVLTFSDEIDANTIGGITFKQGANTIDIAPVVDGTTVTVPYDALAGFTAYTLTVPSTVAGVNGLPVAPEYTLTFTTGERIAPTPVVSEINPADEATDVSIYSDIVIEFSVPMDVDTLDDIVVKNAAGEAIVYTYEMSNNDKVMTITPDEALAVLADYTVVIPVTVISAEDKPLAEEVTATFTTADYPITSSTVLWSENFDGLTEGRAGWGATIADYTGGALTQKVVDGSTVTWDMVASEYTGKVVFEDGKLKIGEKGNTEHGGAGATVTIPVTLSGAHPTTGYTVFEYDYFTDAMATRNRNNEYTNHDITLSGGKTIYMLDITSTNGVQTLLGASYSSSSKDDYLAVINGTHKENIRSSAGMSGKTAHIQVVFDLEQLKYKIFVEVDGNISTLSDEWTALPDGTSVENFVSTLKICQQDSNTGSSTFTLAQYDNFKYSAYDVLPQAMGASTDGLTSVAIDSEVVVTFNGVLAELNTDSISFTADGEEVEFTAEIIGDGNKIKITPVEDLPYSAICEIKFADNMTTEDGYIMSGSTIEFITEPKPVSFVQTGITFKDAAGNVITSLGAETEVHVEGVFENTTDAAQSITKIIVAYDASGKKLKSAFVTDTIAANDTKTINLDIDIDGLGATTIKVFAIDSFANLTPMISTEVLN